MIKLKQLLNEGALNDTERGVADLYAYAGIKSKYDADDVKRYGQDVVDMAEKMGPKVKAYQNKLKSIVKDVDNSKEGQIIKQSCYESKAYGGGGYGYAASINDMANHRF